MKKTSTSIILKAPSEIEKMRVANSIVGEVLQELKTVLAAGMTTLDLDRIAAEGIEKRGGSPAFRGYRGYPATLCVSINNEIVHGIPDPKRVVAEGDVVSMDLGAIYDGFYGDSAISVIVGGKGTETARRLLHVTETALYKGIEYARPKHRLQDISAAVQSWVEGNGFSVVRQFVGHGIGRSLHEPPEVPNFGRRGRGPILKVGMVLAIEPMVTVGSPEVKVLSDGWTAVTADGSLAAHFEHTVAITKKGPYILSKVN